MLEYRLNHWLNWFEPVRGCFEAKAQPTQLRVASPHSCAHTHPQEIRGPPLSVLPAQTVGSSLATTYITQSRAWFHSPVRAGWLLEEELIGRSRFQM